MLVAVAVLVVIGSIDSIAADGPLVETNYGTVRGLSLTNYQGGLINGTAQYYL